MKLPPRNAAAGNLPGLLFATVLAALFFLSGNNACAETAVSADVFLNSIGVNSSINSRGETVEDTIKCAKYLGVRWFRIGRGGNVPDLLELHKQAGVRFCTGLGSGGVDVAKLINDGKQLAAAGALLAFEGNNEPNNWGVKYQGEAGGQRKSWLPVAKLQRDLYSAVKGDPVLKEYPVWSLSEGGAQTDNAGLQFLTIPGGAGTLMPDGTRYADYANCHNYIGHSNWPGLHDNQAWVAADPTSACKVDGLYGNYGKTWMKKFQGYSEAELLKLPRVTTETGRLILKGDTTEEQQARLNLDFYLAQFKRGWSYTAIYLLRDRSDEGGNQQWGFYRADYTPRKAALYLHNLTAILADTGSIPVLGQLNYSIPNQPATVHELLLQKSDGKFELVVWNERFASGGNDEVTVNLSGEYATVKIYDPTTGTEATQTLSNVNSVLLSLGDHPVIIEIPAGK
ncbi:MAG TPA: glycosyl hydrolase [Lentisphaeria bacterium]|nr:glycosyl hydrolase [Lentisphaeria bacterium]